MSGLRPTSLRPGERVQNAQSASPITWTFVRRVPGKPGRPAHCVLQSDECKGLNGPADLGFATASDYSISRHFVRVAA